MKIPWSGDRSWFMLKRKKVLQLLVLFLVKQSDKEHVRVKYSTLLWNTMDLKCLVAVITFLQLGKCKAAVIFS